jgi:hypothetical protein
VSFLSVIVLNLIIVNILPFLPGLFWKKKGEPPFDSASTITTKMTIGLAIKSSTNANMISKKGFIIFTYILVEMLELAKLSKKKEVQ